MGAFWKGKAGHGARVGKRSVGVIPSCGRREHAGAVPGQSAKSCAKCTSSGIVLEDRVLPAVGGSAGPNGRRDVRSNER